MADDLEAFLRRAAELRREKAAAKQEQTERQAQRSAASRPRPYSDRARERASSLADENEFEPTPLIDRLEVDDDVIVLSEAAIIEEPRPPQPATPKVQSRPVSAAASPSRRGQHAVDDLIRSLQSPAGLRQAFLVREILDRKHF